MRVALAQIASTPDPARNLELVRRDAARAAEVGAELVVFPEATMATFARRSSEVAEPLDGPFARGVREAARDAGVPVAVGMFTPGRPAEGERRARVRNTLLVTGPGVAETTYDKIHLYDAFGFEESRHVEAGSRPLCVEVAGVTVGLATCYDVRFPEFFKYLAHEAGARVIIVPSSWANGPGKAEQWRALCVARALDSTCWIVAVGMADPATAGFDVKPGSPTGVGHSVVASPVGEVVAEAGAAPRLLVADIDVAAVDAVRSRLPVLSGSRFRILPPRP